ncbi:MAG: DUF6325 family protein [Cellulomonas sp.]
MPTRLRADSIGPVDVALIVFEKSEFNGEIAPALAELHDNGTVNVIDLAFVRKEDDGTTSIIEVADADIAADFGRVYDSQFDLLNDDDLKELSSGLEPGSSAMVVVWENAWLARLASAVRSSKGQVAVVERIPHESVQRAIAALDEN